MDMTQTLDEIKNRMKELQRNRSEQISAIQVEKAKAREEAKAAIQDMEKAEEELNLAVYEEAKERRDKAQTALEMYEGRYSQLMTQKHVTEKESDEAIDALLDYERQLETEFKAAIVEPLKKLAELLEDYKTKVLDVERTMDKWQREIHANYRSFGRSSRYDEATGQYTDRMERPVPVHTFPYDGCSESIRMVAYLKKEAHLLED